ncbi:MAG: 2-oxo acid dehydrogenase subunit E2 [Spirochaetales bacterium]|nr:2-oxo acid dehydrogenase subunit E2 [Spirochaetales bacterium]
MVTIIEMPKYGIAEDEGIITDWLFEEGEKVEKGDEIVEVETEKISNAVESTVDGILRKIVAEVGSTRKSGDVLGIISTTADEDISQFLVDSVPVASDLGETQTEKEPSTITAQAVSEILITPRAKQLADEKGVNYSGITGTGIGGAITRDDIKKCIPDGEVPKQLTMSPLRKTISSKMMESLDRTAQTTMTMDIEVSTLVEAYKKYKSLYNKENIKLSYTAILVKVIASVIQEYPIFHSKITENNQLEIISDINIGIAVDIDDGLIVPVLKNVDKKDLEVICQELEELTGKAKKRGLSEIDLSGGIITLTNLGMYGVKYFSPILNYPEASILGVGAIENMPVVNNGKIEIGSTLTLSLTHDHRIIDGGPAARFLNAIKELMMNPEELF